VTAVGGTQPTIKIRDKKISQFLLLSYFIAN
jgi:hypothetical protein